MMILVRATVLFFAGILIAQTASGQGQESLIFELAADPRGAALGGAVMADLNSDLHGAGLNPCFIDTARQGDITIDYIDYFAGVGMTAVNYQLMPKGHWRKQIGSRFMNLGTFNGYDAAGNQAQNFQGGDQMVYFGASRAIDSVWTIGAQGFMGSRHLNREVAGWLGVEAFLHARWMAKQLAMGVAVTGAGHQWGLKGSQPTGSLPYNVQLALSKGFNNAPFRIFLKAQHLQTWDLAPQGTYDDSVDPITQEVVANSSFKFGDQLMRHVTIGTALSAGEAMEIWFGFDYRRRAELMATDRLNGNGLSFGAQFQIGKFDVRIARSRYHFAGASTHIGIRFNPRQFARS
ncbi:MAG: hypothetical protein CL828_02415 [Crocinitomicaceae bacterium]|nr:hypothetical protein [Crocinitomicaceae bacterium]